MAEVHRKWVRPGLTRRCVSGGGFIPTNSSTAAAWLTSGLSLTSAANRLRFGNSSPNCPQPSHAAAFRARVQGVSELNESDFIVGYVEHGKLDGTLYLLMDYVEASNLKLLLARQDPVLTENAAQILIDMALGLNHVHESGFMHLDFKPENVLVTGNGNVRLIDFDLAQPILEKPKKMSENPGTPGYMSPEQLQGKPVDSRVDIFAYGVAAYELLTNHKPFPGETPAEILGSQLQPAAPIPPREHNADIPVALEKIILKCLARDPDRRHPYVSVLVHELQSALYV